MKASYIYTALIDVLAYRSRLEQDIASGTFSFKSDLERALSVFDSVNAAVFGVQAISDTIIITCNTHENFLEFVGILKSVFIAFLERGLYVRGGVAYSKHFQSGRLTYSHAVAKAYEIESQLAIYPRIVVDHNIIEMYRSGTSLPTIFCQGLLSQHNGTAFVNVLAENNWDHAYDCASRLYRANQSS